MPELPVTEQILMIVKTYPTPSTEHGETVCTAGIRLRDGAWVRIYPYPFRLVDIDVQFKKWEVIEVPLVKATRDPRPESYKLHDVSSIRSLRTIDPQKGTWADRMAYLAPTVFPSVQSILDGIPSKGDQNWGQTIRPVQIVPTTVRFAANHIGDQWTPEELGKLARAEELATGGLFAPESVPERKFTRLNKVPYDFRLSFEDLTGARYDYKILDWEIAQLFFRMRQQTGSEKQALAAVRQKIEEEICVEKRDVFLILGNMHHQYKQRVLAIDGFVYPTRPKPKPPPQVALFGE